MRVPGLEETGAARDTQSKGRKEHSKEWAVLQGLPLGQTLGSATAWWESETTWFPCWGPAQPKEHWAGPAVACRSVWTLAAICFSRSPAQ